jgi:hypothetical protein
MTISDERLMAYADGELDGAARAEVEAALARDPELARTVERHRALSARLRAGYADVLQEPVPERLSALLGAERPASVADFAAARDARLHSPERRRVPGWVALAASFVVAALVGLLLLRAPEADYERVDGQLVARGPLERALFNELASRPSGSGVAIGLSFRDREGRYCRTFHIERDAPAAGLACRAGEGWALPVLAEAPSQAGDLRAAAAMPLAVLEAVDAAIAGEPLDAAAEAAARDAGWRNAPEVAE